MSLGQVLLTAVVTAVVGLLVMESYQTTPWLADRLMRWSVRLRYVDNPERATIREEELISLLGDLPTLFKLPTAGLFLLRALTYRLVNRRSHGSHSGLAVKRDAFLFSVLYVFNCFAFSEYTTLCDAATEPWLLLPWLYGAIILIPLAWRDRAPVTVFLGQWVLTMVAWPFMHFFVPMVGIPVALYAVSFRCSRKVSLLALLASAIPMGLDPMGLDPMGLDPMGLDPMGLDAAVAFKVYDTYPSQLQSFVR